MKIRGKIISLAFVFFFFEEAIAKASPLDIMKGISISGQSTAIYQSSNLDLKVGDLKNANGTNLTAAQLQPFDHGEGTGSFSADLVVEKRFNEDEFVKIDFQIASGLGVDASLQGGAMANNDIMEDPNNRGEVYLARAFYEKTIRFDDRRIVLDIGKFAVNDYFDVGRENSDQTTQFLNQAIVNNGAFDFEQGLDGRGYTYGIRAGFGNDFLQLDLGFFSPHAQLNNIIDNNSIIAGLSIMPNIAGNDGVYQFYVFQNRGEYAAFDESGNLLTVNANLINTPANTDNLNKNGFGVSATQALSDKINMFAKYGKQDDDRDVRNYNDKDESYMVGANFSGKFWSRIDDEIGVAYQVGRLTGNHRKAHEKGYSGLFDRSGGVGVGNYGDESVFEVYYRYALSGNSSISIDAQHISNFYYSKVIGDAQFYAGRFNVNYKSLTVSFTPTVSSRCVSERPLVTHAVSSTPHGVIHSPQCHLEPLGERSFVN